MKTNLKEIKFKRILVIGCPGSGKSTFSKKLGAVLGLNVVHLDKYFWKAGWVMTSKDEWSKIVLELISKDSWIIDGNYSSMLKQRTDRSDLIIFFDLATYLCLFRIFKRIIKSKLHIEKRDDINENCPEKWFDKEFVKYVLKFNKNIRHLNYEILNEQKSKNKTILIFKNPGQ